MLWSASVEEKDWHAIARFHKLKEQKQFWQGGRSERH
jgi:hypothetical protein